MSLTAPDRTYGDGDVYTYSAIRLVIPKDLPCDSFRILSKSPVLSTCPFHTNSGCGKERRIPCGPW